jgi:MoxR-like ATPase
MTKRPIDISTSFREIDYEAEPGEREIENPDVDPVPEKDPPMMMVPRELYLADGKLAEAVDLAIALGRPLLLQGEPGSGKTRLAYAVAYALKLPLEKAYIKSTSRAQDLLYTYDAIKRLYDAQLKPGTPGAHDGAQASPQLDIRGYIRLGPLGRAIARAQYGRRSVVLIDEIDKADLDFPNDLLWELERLEFSVAENPEMHYKPVKDPRLRPIVFVTHNEEKALPPAFLRRCIYHYVELPEDRDRLHKILKTHQIRDQKIGRRAIDVLLELRKLDLTKKPGLSELLDWVGYLEAVQAPAQDLVKLPYLGALLKDHTDQNRARDALRAT